LISKLKIARYQQHRLWFKSRTS